MEPTKQFAYAHPPANGLDTLRARINSRRWKARFATSAIILIAAITMVFWPNDATRHAGPSETSVAHIGNGDQSLKIENGAAIRVPTDRDNVRLYWVMALNSEQHADSDA